MASLLCHRLQQLRKTFHVGLLDAQRQAGFLDLLLQESTASGAAVVFVSHDERLAAHFDRRVALTELNRAAALAEA